MTAAIQTYEEKLQTLSEGSVHQHFDPWTDIDWDNPDYAVSTDDPRWVLPKADALGRSAWYQAAWESVRRERRFACST